MLFVDEFCGVLVYIKFGADVTSQYDESGDITGRDSEIWSFPNWEEMGEHFVAED